MTETRPIIRLLHQLPRSGGTIINRCLGTMQNNVVLSEVHPRSINKAVAFNPMIQAHQWFDLVDSADFRRWRRASAEQAANFAASINLIALRAEEQHKHLILREYSQPDYIKTPRTQPSFTSTTFDHLRDKAILLRLAVVRHPLQQWRSFENYQGLKGRCRLADFVHGYYRFAKLSAKVGFIRYEDFCSDPDNTLQKICAGLELDYDPTYAELWPEYRFVTGDESRSDDAKIGERKRPLADDELLMELQSNGEYHSALDILGYN